MPSIKNIKDFAKMKQSGEPIAMITCYDYAFARIVSETDIDVILVGDSLEMVVAGYETTIPVTLDQMIYHSTMVRRGAPQSFIVTDLPFMRYHVSIEDTMRNCVIAWPRLTRPPLGLAAHWHASMMPFKELVYKKPICCLFWGKAECTKTNKNNATRVHILFMLQFLICIKTQLHET